MPTIYPKLKRASANSGISAANSNVAPTALQKFGWPGKLLVQHLGHRPAIEREEQGEQQRRSGGASPGTWPEIKICRESRAVRVFHRVAKRPAMGNRLRQWITRPRAAIKINLPLQISHFPSGPSVIGGHLWTTAA
jgi:hypothetical protein